MVRIRNFASFLIGGFLIGVCLANLAGFDWPTIGLFFILTLVFVTLSLIFRSAQLFLVVAFFCLGIIFGLSRCYFLDTKNFIFDNELTKSTEHLALVISDPDRRDASTRLTVKFYDSNKRALVVTDNFTDYAYGDKLSLVGKFVRPQNFLTDNGKVFDYQNYLATRGINQISYYPKIKIVSHQEGNLIKTKLLNLKNRFLDNLNLSLSEPSASLASGLILGDKRGLGREIESDFRRAGLTHIVVLSGYNITVVAENVLRFFIWLALPFPWLFALISIFLFVAMTAGEAAIIRAALMGSIALLARHYGRNYEAGISLIFVSFLMVFWNPRLLVFDLGFQLSFLATLGLIYLSPLVSSFVDYCFSGKIWGKLKNSLIFCSLKDIICTTTGAQMAVFPWLLYRVGEFSLIGFLSNLFVLPFIPLAMFFSFLTGLLGFLSYQLSLLFGYPAYFLLTYIIKSAYLFARLL